MVAANIQVAQLNEYLKQVSIPRRWPICAHFFSNLFTYKLLFETMYFLHCNKRKKIEKGKYKLQTL